MREIGTFTIPANHRSLDGHFPDRPVVPGVVVLESAYALAASDGSTTRALALSRVKFTRPVLPEQPVTVLVGDPNKDGRFTLQCRVDEELALEAMITPS